MPFVSIDAWEGNTDEKAAELVTAVTEAVQRVTKAPSDHIIVLFRANPVKYWAQGGVFASDPDFIEKSREY